MRARNADWVSKLDVTTYLRCPYTYSLLYRGEITPAEIHDEYVGRLLRDGIVFHEQVDATAVTEIPAAAVPAALADGATVLHTGLYRNDDLRIVGIPDGIEGRDYVPIEFKAHRRPRRSDLIELAFYWHLLAPQRAAKTEQPRGVLMLRRDDEEERVEVDLTPKHLQEALDLVAAVRLARVEPVRPQPCRCHVCTVVRGDEVRKAVFDVKHPGLIQDVGPERATFLQSLGVGSYDALLRHSAREIWAEFYLAGYNGVSEELVGKWQQHARAFQIGAPVLFGDQLRIPNRYVVLDLEYLTYPFERMWLAGALLIGGDRKPAMQFWADNDDDSETDLIRGLGVWLADHPDLPIVTWNGDSADGPQLRRAAARLGIPDPLRGRQCIDMLAWAKRSARFPIPSLSLKEVARFFQIPRQSGIAGGAEAMMLYLDLQSGTVEPGLREQLLRYNEDDLEATAELVDELARLEPSPILIVGDEPLPNATPIEPLDPKEFDLDNLT